MAICINGVLLSSSKVDSPISQQWVIGKNLTFKSISLEEINLKDQEEESTIFLKSNNNPYPYIEIPGIVKVTGTITLLENKISGGKSDEHGS